MVRISVRILCSCLILYFGLGETAALDETDQEITDPKKNLQDKLIIQENFETSPFQENKLNKASYATNIQNFSSLYSQNNNNNNNKTQNTESSEEKQQLLPAFNTKLNSTIEDMIPDFFKSSAKEFLPGKTKSKISELDSNQVSSAFDVIKNILNNETKSNSDSKDWNGCLNKDLELIKMISKSFFPGEETTDTLKIKENVIVASSVQGKTNFLVTPSPTERYSTENGTVKVLVGKWDLDKDKNNISVTCVTASSVSPMLADYNYSPTTSIPESEIMKENYFTREMSYLKGSTMDMTTAKVTDHVCSKCSKKWGLALKGLEELDKLSSTPFYEKRKFDSSLTTQSNAYLDFIKILDTFSITTEQEESQNILFSPTRSNIYNIFISENSTEKSITGNLVPPERRPTCKVARVSTMPKEFNLTFSKASTISSFKKDLFTQLDSSNSAVTDIISPTKSKAHMELVKIFDTTKSLTPFWENIAYSWNDPSTLIPFKNLITRPGKESNNVEKVTETILPLKTVPIENKNSLGPNVQVTPITEEVTKKSEKSSNKTPEIAKTTLGQNVLEASTKLSTRPTETAKESVTKVYFEISSVSEDASKTTAKPYKEPATTEKQIPLTTINPNKQLSPVVSNSSFSSTKFADVSSDVTRATLSHDGSSSKTTAKYKEPTTTEKLIPLTTSFDNVTTTPRPLNPFKQSSPAASINTPASTKFTAVSSVNVWPTTLSQYSSSLKHEVAPNITESSTQVTTEFHKSNISKNIPTTTLPSLSKTNEYTLQPLTKFSNTHTICATTDKSSSPISEPTTQSSILTLTTTVKSKNKTSSYVGSTEISRIKTSTASSIKSIGGTLPSTTCTTSFKESTSTEVYSTRIKNLEGVKKNTKKPSTSEPSSISYMNPCTSSVPIKETTKLKDLVSSTYSYGFGSSFSEIHQVKTTIPYNELSNTKTPIPSTISFNESFSNESSSNIPSTTKPPYQVSPLCTAPYTIKPTTSSATEVGSLPPINSVNDKYSITLRTTQIEETSKSEPTGLSTPTKHISIPTSKCPISKVTFNSKYNTATTLFPSQSQTKIFSVYDTTLTSTPSPSTSKTTLSNDMKFTTTLTLNSDHVSSKPSVEAPSSTIVTFTEYKMESSSKINSTPALTTASSKITSAKVTEEINNQDGIPCSTNPTLSSDQNFPLTTVPIYATRVITENINETISEPSTSETTKTTKVTVSSVDTSVEESTKPAKDILTNETPEPNMFEFPNAGPPISSFDFYGLQPYNSSITVRQYVADISEKAAAVNNKNVIAQWNHETNITHKNYKIAMVSTLELIHYQRIQNQFLDSLRDVQVYDPMLEREIKLLYLPGMCILPDIKIAVFEEMLYAMDSIFSSASVIAWNNPHVRYHLPDVKKAMSVSNIPEELSYYWSEWRNVTGRKLRRLYEQYVELMNLTAISNGFCDASEMWTRDYETEDFMQLMGCHWEEIRPLYLELHAYVRCKLHKHYGDVTMTNDYSLPIPAHLVGDLWGQSWKTLFNITRPYEKVYDYPTMDIRSKGYTTTKMALYAEAFFSSLGFPSLPESFWKNSILTKQKTEMSCEPTAWDACDGKDFRIKMCSNGTLKDFFDIHHELTHVEYFIQYKDLSFPFRAGPNPGFHEALAGTILLSVQNPSHLTQVGLAPKSKSHSADVDINYLLRVALDKVAFLPYSYIVDLWRYKVFKGDIKPNDYNRRWWELRLQYQGLAPPIHRTEDDFDPGCKFHIAGNKPYIQNFLSTILQFQFHEALCRRAGLITPKNPLHNCDISNSHVAGTYLRRVMSMGATQHWRVAMNELTGTRQISSKGLVEFFKPLLAWLRKENMRNGQKIGWKNTINLF